MPKIQQEHWQPHKVIPDDLYDKLFDLVKFNSNNSNNSNTKKRKTKKRLLTALKHKKTKKN